MTAITFTPCRHASQTWKRELSPREKIRRRQRAEYRIGKAIAFVAPLLIPILKSRVTLWITVAVATPFAIVRAIIRRFKKP